MRTLRRFAVVAGILGLAFMLASCGGAKGPVELTSDESPVPDGIPVMYEFYTLT